MGLSENGYLVFPNVISEELCQAVIWDIEDHLNVDPPILPNACGMVEIYHCQSMWDVRQHCAVHNVFSDFDLFGRNDLWVSIDRVSKKMPGEEDPDEYYNGGFISCHWDININQRPRPFAVQGVIALVDTDEDMGGFQCMPGLYKELDNWLAQKPCGKAWQSYVKPPYPHEIVRVPMKAGSLLVWDSFLPHGNGLNRGNKIRYAQYVTMMLKGDNRLRTERINCWKTNSPPSDWAFPGDPRMIEQKKKPAILVGLGRKLLGLDEW